MSSSGLPEPFLTLTLGAAANIEQDDDKSLSRFWAVLTKVRDAVVDGHRLENLSWRLWHRARRAPERLFGGPYSGDLPRFPEILSRALASPPQSFSSSEGTAISDWDRDTAVGEEDDLQTLHNAGARRSTTVSPLAVKSYLNLAPTRAVPHPALFSMGICHQQDPSQGLFPRPLPSSTPHHPSLTRSTAEVNVCRVQPKGHISISESPHQSPKSASSTTGGPHVPSSTSPHDPLAQLSIQPLLPNTLSRTSLSDPETLFVAEVLRAAVVASPMPITLTTSRKDALTVGRLLAQIFSEPSVRKSSQDKDSDNAQDHPPYLDQVQSTQNVHALPSPKIIEPPPPVTPMTSSTQPSTPTAVSNSVSASVTSTPRQIFPTVIVVNPTPHPTPPATPSPPSSAQQLELTAAPIPIGTSENIVEVKWNGPTDQQLATPVSVRGDALSIDSMVQDDELHVETHPMSSLLPAAAIALPGKPVNANTSQLSTPVSPSSLARSELSDHDSKRMTVMSLTPVPSPVLSEEKKFFLAAPSHGSGGSGHELSESPDSSRGESLSPDRHNALHSGRSLGAGDVNVQQESLGHHEVPRREEDVASSFSNSSLPGRVQSGSSARGSSASSRFKGRSGLSTASGAKRKSASKKVVLVVNEDAKEAEAGAEVKPEGSHSKLAPQVEKTSKCQGKEREVGARAEETGCVSTAHVVRAVESPQHPPSRRPHPHPQNPVSHLRQLPTNPPRRYQSPVRRPTSMIETQARANPSASPNARQLPYHPQLAHMGLGHLPTVPPKQRRPIEITETSSEFETTDTEGDESSWESESISGDEGGDAREAGSSKRSRDEADSTSKVGKPSGATTNNNNRTRDAGDFARDAALEAQRQRDLFQKLPPRSYSNLAQLPRTKSGLSLLFRPDPELFPDGHPYRTTRSSRDILARNWSAPAPPWMGAASKRAPAVGPVQAAINADPVVASVNSKTSITATAGRSNSQKSNVMHRGYRPRGKPADQEEETTSDEQDPEDTIQVSKSVAQKRLAALIAPRGAQPQGQPQRPALTQSTSHPSAPTQPQAPDPPSVTRTTTLPILMHPYLPDPVPLQTPQTVRRNIISQELDEELRRNLLWERSQNQIQGRPPRMAGSILPGPWRPVTPSKTEGDSAGTQVDKAPGKRPFATQRTKSWAGDYHASGW